MLSESAVELPLSRESSTSDVKGWLLRRCRAEMHISAPGNKAFACYTLSDSDALLTGINRIPTVHAADILMLLLDECRYKHRAKKNGDSSLCPHMAVSVAMFYSATQAWDLSNVRQHSARKQMLQEAGRQKELTSLALRPLCFCPS